MNRPNSRTYTLGIKVNPALYQAYKLILKKRKISVTEDIEAHIQQVIDEEYQDSDIEKLKSVMDFIYPEWRDADS